MDIEIKLGCVPANELPMFLNCICKMNIIHNANIANEDGDSTFSDAIEVRRKEAVDMKLLLLQHLKLLVNINRSAKILDSVKYNQNLKKLDIETSVGYIDKETKEAKSDCISIIGEILIKLLGITDEYTFNSWLKENMMNDDEYIDSFIEFADTPTDNLTKR